MISELRQLQYLLQNIFIWKNETTNVRETFELTCTQYQLCTFIFWQLLGFFWSHEKKRFGLKFDVSFWKEEEKIMFFRKQKENWADFSWRRWIKKTKLDWAFVKTGNFRADWLQLFLKTASTEKRIGGLSRKASKDEAQGAVDQLLAKITPEDAQIILVEWIVKYGLNRMDH